MVFSLLQQEVEAICFRAAFQMVKHPSLHRLPAPLEIRRIINELPLMSCPSLQASA